MFDYTHATLQHLPLSSIHIPGYHDINFDVIKGNVALLKDHPKQDLPPIIVKMKQEGEYDVQDGRHRHISYMFAERSTIPAIIINSKKVKHVMTPGIVLDPKEEETIK